MKKSIIAGIIGLVAVTGAAAAFGTKYTGSQVDSFLGQTDSFLLNEYGFLSVTNIHDKSLLSSSAQTIINLISSSEEQEGVQLISDYEITNGPLGASYEGTMDIIFQGESLFSAESNIPKPIIEGSIGVFSNDGKVRLEAFDFNDYEEAIVILEEDAVFDFSSKNDFSAFAGEFIIPSLRAINIDMPEESIILKNMSIVIDQEGNWMEQIENLNSYTRMSIEALKLGPDISITEAELEQDYSLDDGILDFDMSMRLGSFNSTDELAANKNGSANIEISLNGLNFEPFIPLILNYQEIRNQKQNQLSQENITMQDYFINGNTLMAEFFQQNAPDIMKAAGEMLATSMIKLEVEPSYIETDSMGKTDFNGFVHLDTRDINIAELMLAKENPMFLIDHADKLEAEVSIEGLPASLSMVTGGETVIKAEIKNGVATVNENVLFDANKLGQMSLMK